MPKLFDCILISKGGNVICKGLNPNTKSKDQGNLHDYNHVIDDFEAHSKRISSEGDFPFANIIEDNILIKEDVFKSDILDMIIVNANLASQNKDELTIYYSGHGDDKTGNWITADKYKWFPSYESYTVSLQEVLQTIENTGFRGTVTIVCDCCYSGKWAY